MLKTRVIVAVVGIPLLIAVIFFTPLPAFACVVGAIAAYAALEFIRSAAPDSEVRFIAYAMAAAFVTPVGVCLGAENYVIGVTVFALFAIMLCELIIAREKGRELAVSTVTVVMFAGAAMPVILSALIRLGLMGGDGLTPVYVFLPFVITFSSDSGAYFAGVYLGKHKLIPNVSPNKTIEGSIGGFVLCIAAALLYGFILSRLGFAVSYLLLVVYGFFGSLACQIGDLAFSAIKRSCGVKDFGSLIPGHGGVLDRFDSMFFVAPVVEILVLIAPAITNI